MIINDIKKNSQYELLENNTMIANVINKESD